MKIVVGSTNPVKIQAVREGFGNFYPDCEAVGAQVASGVSAQPMSEKETVNGARQRAYAALETDPKADYGVGLEGGVTEIDPTTPNWTGMHGGKGRLFECAWVAIVDRKGKEGLGGGLYFELPVKVAEKIKKGGELGPIMDELSGESNVKQKSGAIGIFTKGKLTRQQAYEQLVMQALIKFVSPEWFE